MLVCQDSELERTLARILTKNSQVLDKKQVIGYDAATPSRDLHFFVKDK